MANLVNKKIDLKYICKKHVLEKNIYIICNLIIL